MLRERIFCLFVCYKKERDRVYEKISQIKVRHVDKEKHENNYRGIKNIKETNQCESVCGF